MTCENLSDSQKSKPQRRVYGRRQGRPLKSSRVDALKSLLPAVSIPEEDLTENGTVDPEIWFSRRGLPLWMEIGFGNGEHLSALMREHPENNYIGAEPFVNGVSAFLKDIAELQKDNIRIHMDDALEVISSIKPESLHGIYVLNPDPWPKTRHHKRRIISKENLDAFARVMKPGGSLIMTTDVDDLAEWMLTQTFTHGGFEWTAESRKDWKSPPPGWTETRYEKKGRDQGRSQSYLVFRKK